MNPTAVIADDEPLLRLHLKQMLGDIWPELDIVGVAENGAQALLLIEKRSLMSLSLIFVCLKLMV